MSYRGAREIAFKSVWSVWSDSASAAGRARGGSSKEISDLVDLVRLGSSLELEVQAGQIAGQCRLTASHCQ